MSNYKGFITQAKYIELTSLLREITDRQGLENKIHHLYSPDTDMKNKICENLEDSKLSIIKELFDIMHTNGKLCMLLADKILSIKEE